MAIPPIRDGLGRFIGSNAGVPDRNVVDFNLEVRHVILGRRSRSWLAAQLATVLVQYGSFPTMIDVPGMRDADGEVRYDTVRQLIEIPGVFELLVLLLAERLGAAEGTEPDLWECLQYIFVVALQKRCRTRALTMHQLKYQNLRTVIV